MICKSACTSGEWRRLSALEYDFRRLPKLARLVEWRRLSAAPLRQRSETADNNERQEAIVGGKGLKGLFHFGASNEPDPVFGGSGPFGAEEPELFIVTLNLNAPLQPMDRGVLEEALDIVLKKLRIGEVTGGGTLLSDSGGIENCDIELVLEGTPPEPVSRVTAIVEDMGVPKGSSLIWTDEFGRAVRLPVGRLEGLAVHINGTDLPEEVYRTCDINFVVERMDALMEGIGRQYSYWEGEQETSLYFYGTSYEKMLEAIGGFLNEYPLCQQCRTEQIA